MLKPSLPDLLLVGPVRVVFLKLGVQSAHTDLPTRARVARSVFGVTPYARATIGAGSSAASLARASPICWPFIFGGRPRWRPDERAAAMPWRWRSRSR